MNSIVRIYKRFMGEEVLTLTDYERKTGRRIVYTNSPEETKALGYPNNRITNTKYRFWNFIPKTLIEQFSRTIHQYFLLLAILQLWKVVTPVHPITTWVPLIFIVSVGACKEAYDDYCRMKEDNKANKRPVQVIRRGTDMVIAAQQIMVGDIVRVQCEEEFPCDMCLLRSSDEKGLAYIQTANLDGETGLKTRVALKETRNLNQQEIHYLKAVIECAPPNDEIYKFDASLQLRHAQSAKKFAMNDKQLLLQGSFLKNTEWVYGVAVYTGNQTKLGQNKHVPHIKWTQADQFINQTTIFIFCVQLIIMFAFGIAGDVWSSSGQQKWFYLAFDRSGPQPWYTPVIIPLRFLLISSLMVPISLKVTLDICKFWYALFIDWDLELYDEKSNTPAKASNTSISEDLGQVEYLFTDKTGTLTENEMVFKRVSINGRIYSATSLDGPDPLLLNAVNEGNDSVIQMLIQMAVCNSATPYKEIDGTLNYRGVSPDEVALARGAAMYGISLVKRDDDAKIVEVNVKGKLHKFAHIARLEFTPERKQSSVIVKDLQNNKIYLFTMGADDVILSKLKKGQDKEVETISNQLDDFAKEGLRTLCLAKRELDDNILKTFMPAFEKASASIENREQVLADLYKTIEIDLTLSGATAIEDRLQDGVPETIQLLRKAGIVIWMLTGDKMQTAIQIATSCNLIKPDDTLLTIKGNNHFEVADSIMQCLQQAKSGVNSCVVIDGKTLSLTLPRYAGRFALLCTRASAVICCRTSPKQKALIVRIMKGKGANRKCCLAVGDGGNDVSMLLEADVGVGIAGKEGLQAARAADYVIARFKFLARLLLVHGRLSYYRTSFIAQFCFYKSMIVAIGQVIFGLVNGFSGSTLFNTFALTCYNTFFTALPVVGYLVDKDVSEESLMKVPQIYQYSQSGYNMNAKTMLIWFIRALYQAFVIFLVTFSVYGHEFVRAEMKPMDYWTVGTVCYTSLLFIQTVTIALETNYWTIINHIFIWGSLIFYFVTALIIGLIPWFSIPGHDNMYMVMVELLCDPSFYFCVAITVAIAALPTFVMKYISWEFTPTLMDRVRQDEYYQRWKKMFGRRSSSNEEEERHPLYDSSLKDASASLLEDSHIHRYEEDEEQDKPPLRIVVERQRKEVPETGKFTLS